MIKKTYVTFQSTQPAKFTLLWEILYMRWGGYLIRPIGICMTCTALVWSYGKTRHLIWACEYHWGLFRSPHQTRNYVTYHVRCLCPLLSFSPGKLFTPRITWLTLLCHAICLKNCCHRGSGCNVIQKCDKILSFTLIIYSGYIIYTTFNSMAKYRKIWYLISNVV